jgi:hypothetical protein
MKNRYNPNWNPKSQHPLDFKVVANNALRQGKQILNRLVPNGKQVGSEWVCLNPTRNDRRIGSFKINTKSGKWSDFATGDAGGDMISLVAYLTGSSQLQAAKWILDFLGGR